MERHDQFLKPLCERTSATDFTAKLQAWDVATVAALKAMQSINARDVDGARSANVMMLAQGHQERVRSLNGRLFAWHPTSELDGDDQLVIIPDDRNGDVDTALAADLPGRWLAVPGQTVDLALAFDKDTADAATLYTMPTGANLRLLPGYWEITTGFTGGSSSAIGLSSDQTGHTTKGDLLGGGSGDVAATLVSGDYIEGTIGADIAAGVILKAGKVVRFDRVTSAFTVGAGYAHVVGVLLSNDGA